MDMDAKTDNSAQSAREEVAAPEVPLTEPEGGAPRFWITGRWWRRVAHTSAAVWGATALSFLGTIAAARGLGPAGYGPVVLALSVASLVATFLDLTLEEAVVHHGTRVLASGDVAGLRALLRKSLTLDVAVGIAVSSAIVALASPLADLASSGRLDPTLVRLAALSTLVMTADPTTSAALLVADRPQLRAWAMVAANLFRLAGVLVALQLGGPEAVIVSYVLSGAVGSLVQGVLAWRVGWRMWASAPTSGSSPVSTWRLLRFGFQTSVSTSLNAAESALIPVMLGNLAGPAAVGVFRVAMFPIFVGDTVSGPARLVLFPEQARLAAQGRFGVLRRAMAGYTLLGLAIGLVGAVAGLIALPWLIPLLYSSKFEAAVLPAQILLVAAVCRFALAWGKTFPAAVGRPAVRTAVSAVMLALTLSLVLAFGSQGSKGAAIAYSLASVATAVSAVIVMYRLLASAEAREPATAQGVSGGDR
jgi:O-antigen/teichoic acid export membrane protein